ncbi:hypothetical protein [Anaeromassilibacillus senegalensis]|nr:hypothetical protein [Anaeromassilibacillus senegalensis]
MDEKQEGSERERLNACAHLTEEGALKAARPELYAAFTRETTIRRFTVA